MRYTFPSQLHRFIADAIWERILVTFNNFDWSMSSLRHISQHDDPNLRLTIDTYSSWLARVRVGWLVGHTASALPCADFLRLQLLRRFFVRPPTTDHCDSAAHVHPTSPLHAPCRWTECRWWRVSALAHCVQLLVYADRLHTEIVSWKHALVPSAQTRCFNYCN